MRVREVMSRPVETITEDESAENAFQRMRTARARHLVVVRGTEVVGVISARDLDPIEENRAIRSVRSVMATPAVTADSEMTIRQAANRLRGRSIGCLPVVDGRRLVGIVTTTDLLELIGRGAERPVAKGRRWVMKGRGPRSRPFAG